MAIHRKSERRSNNLTAAVITVASFLPVLVAAYYIGQSS